MCYRKSFGIVIVAIIATMWNSGLYAGCSGGSCSKGSCSSGSCNRSSSVTSNQDTIQDQQQQVRELQQQIKSLTDTLNTLQLKKGIVRDDSGNPLMAFGIPVAQSKDTGVIHQIGRSDSMRIVPIADRDIAQPAPGTITPIQRQTQTTVRAPGVRVQTGQTVTPRPRSGSRWNR